MKNAFILAIKGFIMGIANIIPGVSGGTLALTLGIYENFIGAISHFFSKIKENLKFLLPVFLGMGISILTMSGVIDNSFHHFPIPTTLFFMGLVIGGLPLLISKVKGTKESKKVSSYIILFLTFLIVMILAFSEELFGSGLREANFSNLHLINYLVLMLVGMIAAATMIIPGVSGSLVLMLLGYYFPIVSSIKELAHLQDLGENVLILGFFGVGVVIGIILVAKLIEFLLAKYEKKTYFGVLGFILASIIAIPVSVSHELGGISFSVLQVVIGIFFLLLGLIIGNKLGDE